VAGGVLIWSLDSEEQAPSMSTGHRLQELYELLLAAYGHQGWWPGETPFEVLVGAVLTQNTNWTNVEKAIANLREAGVLSLPALSDLPPERLAGLIRPAGYYNLKARRLANLLAMLNKRWEGDLAWFFTQSTDQVRRGLLDVKGVGPETADSIALYAAHKPVFVVDAYTFRILGRHGLAEPDMGYFELQELFMDALPAEPKLFNEFHALLVRLGKERCKKTAPRCAGCPVEKWLPVVEL
jgi:endonuclease III related protein